MHVAAPGERMRLDHADASPRRKKLRIAHRPSAVERAVATRLVHRTPDKYVIARAGDQRMRALDYRSGDHSRFDLRVPSHFGRKLQMVDDPRHAHDIDAVAIARAQKWRFGISRESVDLLRAQAGVVDCRAAGVEREQAE